MKQIIFSFLVLVFVNCSFASEAEGRAKKIDLILDLSGLQRQTLSLDEVIKEQVNAKMESESNEGIKKLGTILIEEFNAQEILTNIKNEMTSNFSKEEIILLSGLLNEEQNRRFARAEEEASSAGFVSSMQEYFKSRSSLPENRVEIFKKYEKSIGMTKMNLLIVVATIKSLSLSLNDKKLSNDELSEKIRQLMPAMKQTSLMSFIYTYRDFKDAELEKYLEQYNRPSMQKMNKLIITQYEKGFNDWGTRAGKRIKSLVQSQKKINAKK